MVKSTPAPEFQTVFYSWRDILSGRTQRSIQPMRHCPRLAQAQHGKDFLGDADNGLFLAASRRANKLTIPRADPKPELEARGLAVACDVLWSDRRRDLAVLSAEMMGRALLSLNIDIDMTGNVDRGTLSKGRRVLRRAAKVPWVLVVAEARHALIGEAGAERLSCVEVGTRFRRDASMRTAQFRLPIHRCVTDSGMSPSPRPDFRWGPKQISKHQ